MLLPGRKTPSPEGLWGLWATPHWVSLEFCSQPCQGWWVYSVFPKKNECFTWYLNIKHLIFINYVFKNLNRYNFLYLKHQLPMCFGGFCLQTQRWAEAPLGTAWQGWGSRGGWGGGAEPQNLLRITLGLTWAVSAGDSPTSSPGCLQIHHHLPQVVLTGTGNIIIVGWFAEIRALFHKCHLFDKCFCARCHNKEKQRLAGWSCALSSFDLVISVVFVLHFVIQTH